MIKLLAAITGGGGGDDSGDGGGGWDFWCEIGTFGGGWVVAKTPKRENYRC